LYLNKEKKEEGKRPLSLLFICIYLKLKIKLGEARLPWGGVAKTNEEKQKYPYFFAMLGVIILEKLKNFYIFYLFIRIINC